jgi:hypothetical protein
MLTMGYALYVGRRTDVVASYDVKDKGIGATDCWKESSRYRPGNWNQKINV